MAVKGHHLGSPQCGCDGSGGAIIAYQVMFVVTCSLKAQREMIHGRVAVVLESSREAYTLRQQWLYTCRRLNQCACTPGFFEMRLQACLNKVHMHAKVGAEFKRCAGPGGAPLCHAPACRAPLPAASPFNGGRTTVAFVLGIVGGRSLTPFTLQSIERGRFGVLAVLALVVGAPARQQANRQCVIEAERRATHV